VPLLVADVERVAAVPLATAAMVVPAGSPVPVIGWPTSARVNLMSPLPVTAALPDVRVSVMVRTSLVRPMVSMSGSDPCADGETVAVSACPRLNALTELCPPCGVLFLDGG